MKASFLVTAVAPAADMVIANGRVLSDTPGPGADEHTVKFATTRKMSTYLVALAVGDFDCQEAQADGVPLRVCALRGRKPQAQFALEAAESFLHFYDTYFTVKYPFGKLDLVALPGFPGGMENVGAIFFGERELLVDPVAATVESRRLVATTLAHEIAHEWIGDLVTMKWWDDLWLKEGFATFFETRPIEAWKPEWHAELDEVSSAEEAMALDALESTHAARTNVTTPAEIDESYDAIVYQKTGAVLRMVEGAMGPDAFRAGVNAFIRRFSYANATAEDLWTTLAENDVHGVAQILRTFLEQPGVPVVSIATRCITSATSSMVLGQQRFWIDPPRTGASSPLWAIPVSTRPIAPQPGVPGLSRTRLLATREQTFDVSGCNALVLANADALGYFRTGYAPEVLARLAKDAASRLTPAERLRLLDDQWAIARSGGLEIGAYLSLVSGDSAEPSARIVERIGETLRDIDDQLTTDGNREAFHGWVRAVLAPAVQADRRAVDGDNVSHRRLEASALYILGRVGGDTDILARARAAVTGGAAREDPALLDALTRLAASNGDATVFDRVTAGIEHAGSPAVYERNLRALGDFSDPALVRRALEFALSDQVHDADAARVFGSTLENAAARPIAWSFLKGHWNDVVSKSGVDETGTEVLTAAAGFCDAGLRDDARAFLGGTGLGSSLALRQTLERIQACIDFKAAQRAPFERWLAAQTVAR